MVSGVNFLTGILLARYLGIEEFGRFALVWSVTAVTLLARLHAHLGDPPHRIARHRTGQSVCRYHPIEALQDRCRDPEKQAPYPFPVIQPLSL